MADDRSLGQSAPVSAISMSDFLESVSSLSAAPAFRLSTTGSHRGVVEVHHRTLIRKPFCTVRQFDSGMTRSAPKVLVVAPLSGQYAVLLQDVVAGLLPDHSVYITDWRNARDVAAEKGKFDFEDNISYIHEFLRQLGPEVHVLAVCQSAVPALAATALLAAADDHRQPRSLILMGGLIDTRINPTRIDRLAETPAFRRLEEAAISRVPSGFPGTGRSIYPASVQRGGLLAYLARHIEFPAGSPSKLRIRGDPTLADPKFLKRLLTLMDLPAEFYLQNIWVVFQGHALPKGALVWQERKVTPEAISRTALMTVEGEHDDISGRGQTRAAHELCSSLAANKRRHVLQPGVGHFGMYAGRSWFESVLPQVRDFIRGQS
jgi:poly(3-hydroxybutyrate) depolymerase